MAARAARRFRHPRPERGGLDVRPRRGHERATGRIIADVPITLGRPRSVRALQKKDPAYHELYSHVWTKLEEGLLP